MTNTEDLTSPPPSFIKRFDSFPDTVFHEPPIGTGGSSLFLDVPNGINLDDTTTGATNVYTFNKATGPQPKFSSIGALLVITEKDNGFIDVIRYVVPESLGAELHLWFSPGSNAAFKLKNVGTERRLELTGETLDVKTPKPSKPQRPFRRNCGNSAVRIRKWALVDSSGKTIQDPFSGSQLSDAGDDSYHFYISFFHN